MSANDDKAAESSDEARAKAEVILEVEADKRLRDVKAEAAANAEAANEAKKPTNPDG